MGALEAKIHQGRYDSENELLNLRDNAIEKGRSEIIDAVHQRLKKIHPKIYQRLVGPLRERKRDSKFKCYCNYPKSLSEICKDVISGTVHLHCLTCDACWQEDISAVWGYYGWATKKILKTTWDSLCQERANYKFVD